MLTKILAARQIIQTRRKSEKKQRPVTLLAEKVSHREHKADKKIKYCRVIDIKRVTGGTLACLFDKERLIFAKESIDKKDK